MWKNAERMLKQKRRSSSLLLDRSESKDKIHVDSWVKVQDSATDGNLPPATWKNNSVNWCLSTRSRLTRTRGRNYNVTQPHRRPTTTSNNSTHAVDRLDKILPAPEPRHNNGMLLMTIGQGWSTLQCAHCGALKFPGETESFSCSKGNSFFLNHSHSCNTCTRVQI